MDVNYGIEENKDANRKTYTSLDTDNYRMGKSLLMKATNRNNTDWAECFELTQLPTNKSILERQ